MYTIYCSAPYMYAAHTLHCKQCNMMHIDIMHFNMMCVYWSWAVVYCLYAADVCASI